MENIFLAGIYPEILEREDSDLEAILQTQMTIFLSKSPTTVI